MRPGPLVHPDRRWSGLPRVLSPVGFVSPSALPVRGIHFPARRVPPGRVRGSRPGRLPVVPPRLTPRRFHRASSRGTTPASVRLRRFPRPWRLAPPCTLWRISATHTHGVRLPCSPRDARRRRPEGRCCGHGGRAFGTRPSRSSRADGARAEALPPSASRNRRFGRECDRSGARTPSTGRHPGRWPATRLPGLPSAGLAVVAPLQGLPSSHCHDLPPACYRGWRPLPPGTDRVVASRASAVGSVDPPAPTTVTPLGVPVVCVCRLRPPPHTVGAPEGSSGGGQRVPAPRTRMKL